MSVLFKNDIFFLTYECLFKLTIHVKNESILFIIYSTVHIKINTLYHKQNMTIKKKVNIFFAG